MTPDGLDDAVHQLQLALAAAAYRRWDGPVTTAGPVVEADEAFAAHPLLPGFHRLRDEQREDGPLSPRVEQEFRRLLRQALHPAPGGEPSADAAEAVFACYWAAREGKAIAPKPVPWPQPTATHYLHSWLTTADGLLAWTAITPLLGVAGGGYDPRLSADIAAWRQMDRSLDRAVELLDRAADALYPRPAKPGDTAAWLADLWYRGNQLVRSAPSGWPPDRIAGFRRLCSAAEQYDPLEPRHWDGVSDQSAPPPTADPREQALQLLLDELLGKLDDDNARGKLSPETWDSWQALAAGVLPGRFGPPSLIRPTEPWAPKRHETRVVPGGGPARLVRSGWEVGGRVVRKAEFEVPPPPVPAADRARALGQRVAALDPDLARLCHEAAVEIGTNPRWADALAHDSAKRWWRILQRGLGWAGERPELKACLGELIDECRRVGVTLTDIKREAGTPSADGWYLVSVPAGVPTGPLPAPRSPAANHAVGLQLPDGRVLFPEGHLRVPELASETRPLFRWLAKSAPLLDRIRETNRDWNGWTAVDSLPALAAGCEEYVLDGVTAELLTAAHAAMGEDATGLLFRQLTNDLRLELTTPPSPIAITPSLDAKTLRAQPPASMPRKEQMEIEWVADESKPLGDIVAVDRFGVGSRPAKVRLSSGRAGSEEWTWLTQLPTFPAYDLLPPSQEPFANLYRLLRRDLPWYPAAERATRLAAAFDGFARWLTEPASRDWLNRFAALARHAGPDADAARAWWRVLFDGVRVSVYPRLDAESWEPSWPAGVGGAEVRWVPHDAAPRGQAVSEEVRFAVRPTDAVGTFSLGKAVPGGLLDREEGVRMALQTLGRSGWQAHADRLRQASVDAVLADQPTAKPDAAVALLDGTFPSLKDASLAGAAASVVSHLRDWLAAAGFRMTPARWTPERPTEAAEVDRSEVAADPPAFLGGTPGGFLLTRFGLTYANGTVWRAAAAAQSAGPPPKGYDDLRFAVAALDPSDATRALAQSLADWPAAVIANKSGNHADSLEYAAVAWFKQFWQVAQQVMNPQGQLPAGWRHAADVAENLLLEKFRFRAFYPKRRSERPNDVEVVGSGTGTDMVRRVLQPALLKADNQARLRARIEL